MVVLEQDLHFLTEVPLLKNIKMPESQPQQQDFNEKYDASILPDMLPVYYKRLFPHKPFYRWLSYGLSEESVFTNREISFTLHDDIYLRYLCFDSQSEMEKEICSRNPFKIDIGAVMTTRPKNFRTTSAAMVPVQRELVFDIDMSDYNDVRTCCSASDLCTKCWKFMAVAANVLDAALREDFGFEHILWVFSGRRGIHGWVCDHEARHLDSRARNAVAEYLQIVAHVNVNGTQVPRVNIGERTHHSVKRALKFIEVLFEEIILVDQNLFGSPQGVSKLIQMIPDDMARKETEAYLKKSHEDGAASKLVWASFIRFANSMRTSAGSVWSRKLRNITEEIQLSIMYPRLDINVTKGFNHLLKAPFCIHPSTGKVCVPFNVSVAAKFDPTTVPNILKLLNEINAFDDKIKNQEVPEEKNRIKDYKKTSMFKGVLVFEEFLRKLESSFKTKAIDISDQKMEF